MAAEVEAETAAKETVVAEMEAETAAKETVVAEKPKAERTTKKKAVKATTGSVAKAVPKHATPAKAEPVKFRTLVLIAAVFGAAVSGAVLSPRSALGLRQRVEDTMPPIRLGRQHVWLARGCSRGAHKPVARACGTVVTPGQIADSSGLNTRLRQSASLITSFAEQVTAASAPHSPHLCASAPLRRCASAPPRLRASAPLHLRTSAPLHLCTSTPLRAAHLCASAPLRLCASAPLRLCTTLYITALSLSPNRTPLQLAKPNSASTQCLFPRLVLPYMLEPPAPELKP